MERMIQIHSEKLSDGSEVHNVRVGTWEIACVSMEAALRVQAKLEAILASDDVIGASLDDRETA